MKRHYVDVCDSAFADAICKGQIYVDKTMILNTLNDSINNEHSKNVCTPRPKGFGKSLTSSMLCSYYSKGASSHELFKNCQIATAPSYRKHLNSHHTIYINMGKAFLEANLDVKLMMQSIKEKIVEDLKDLDGSLEFCEDEALCDILMDFCYEKDEGFVFIIDDYDAIAHEFPDDVEGYKDYIFWLSLLLKDKDYVDLVFMTGILPLKRYALTGALNMVDVYSMLDFNIFSTDIGLTDEEVKELCVKYHKDFNEMKHWYGGFTIDNHIKVFNTNSVIKAITQNSFQSYLSIAPSFEFATLIINLNIGGIKEILSRLIAGEVVEFCSYTFSNDVVHIKTPDNVLTLLAHFGYLSAKESLDACYYNFTVVVPNHEAKLALGKILDCGMGKWVSFI